MPEAPDLEVVKDVLLRHVVGRRVVAARVLRSTVLRPMVNPDFAGDMARRRIEGVSRRGKFLLLTLSDDRILVVHPMLTGGLELCPPSRKVLKKVCFVLSLDNKEDLRYFDDTQMGQVYAIRADQLDAVPRWAEQGPDVLDEPLSFEQFVARLRKFPGEIKGTLSRGVFVGGIGNAYADEILFAAGVHPFKKRRALSDAELHRVREASYRVPREALAVLRERVGEDIHLKVRDFLKVHGKGDERCPQCSGAITTISANDRLTNYCRHCQPGLLIRM